MKKVFAMIMVFVLLLSLTACGDDSDKENSSEAKEAGSATDSSKETSESSEKDTSTEPVDPTIVRFTVWSQEEATKAAVDAFNSSRDDIQIKLEVIPSAQLQPILRSTLGTPEAPDITWGSVSTEMFAMAGMLAPLDEFVERDDFDLSAFYPATVAQQYRNGVLYGLPNGVDTYAMAYNSAVFDKYGVEYPKADWSWDDYERIARELDAKIRAGGGNEYASGLDIKSSAHFFLPISVSNGAQFINDEGTECLINDPAAVEMMDMVMALINDGVQVDLPTITETKVIDLYIGGLIGMTTMPSYNSALSVVADNDIATTTVILPWPKGPATGTNYVSNTTTNNYVMNSGSEVKDAAWEVMKYLTGEEGDAILSGMKAHTPARISSIQVWMDSFGSIDTSVYKGQLETLVTTTFPDVYLTMLMNLMPNLTPMYNGEITPEETLKNIEEVMNGILSE